MKSDLKRRTLDIHQLLWLFLTRSAAWVFPPLSLSGFVYFLSASVSERNPNSGGSVAPPAAAEGGNTRSKRGARLQRFMTFTPPSLYYQIQYLSSLLVYSWVMQICKEIQLIIDYWQTGKCVRGFWALVGPVTGVFLTFSWGLWIFPTQFSCWSYVIQHI